MKLNLGCGSDVRDGFVNVDIIPGEKIKNVDLGIFPWPWEDSSVDEILMLDFLEHFPYSKTESILVECWRVLKPLGSIVVQVPDGRHLGKVLNNSSEDPFMCNKCGNVIWRNDCNKCGQTYEDIAAAAVARIFGGQDRVGNWHFTVFNNELLEFKLLSCGFSDIVFLENNENGETYYQNWNLKVTAVKKEMW